MSLFTAVVPASSFRFATLAALVSAALATPALLAQTDAPQTDTAQTNTSQTLLAPATHGELQSRQLQGKFGQVSVEALSKFNEDGTVQSRDFLLKVGAGPEPHQVQLQPKAGDALLFSKNPLFDALYSLSEQERQQNSVNEITDWGFNDQQAVACLCFETGAKWNYVWTRDLSYALDLGLGSLDPARARQSLLFKTSAVRPELIARGINNTEVALQDTGSGGSWPVSTDRVVWILAASGLTALNHEGNLDPLWQAQWYPIARNTLLQDRQYAFDSHLGLYRGETSFLDWREQSYPAWTAQDTLFLAESFALSTNVLHYVALRRAAEAAKTLEPERAAEFSRWADALKQAINSWFWLPEQGLYARYLSESQHPVAVPQSDLLGNALAVIHGVATPLQASQLLSRYPLTAAGPAVIFPALPDVPIYHNRAIWPFVSAYFARAAKAQDQAALFHKIAMSLFQGAAFNGSNMENLEWLSQQAQVDDGALTGPVVNSQRQLWSVAAYGDLVQNQLFGLSVQAGTLTLNPYLPVDLWQELDLGEQPQLRDVRLANNIFNLQLQIPSQRRRGQVLRLQSATINGQAYPLNDAYSLQLALSQLTQQQNDIVLTLVSIDNQSPAPTVLRTKTQSGVLSDLSSKERRQLVAPKEPQLLVQQDEHGRVTLQFDAAGEADTRFQLYKNGRTVRLKPRDLQYVDKAAAGPYSQCYSLLQSYKDSGLSSQPSRTLCTDGAVQHFAAGAELVSADQPIDSYLGHSVYKNWGAPEQQLTLRYQVKHSGRQALRLQYFIDNGPINTGITAVVKQLNAVCPQSGNQQATLVMPHLATALEPGWSSQAFFTANADEQCELTISDGFNMSYLQHFDLYTGGKGGRTGPLNQAVIKQAQIRVFAPSN